MNHIQISKVENGYILEAGYGNKRIFSKISDLVDWMYLCLGERNVGEKVILEIVKV